MPDYKVVVVNTEYSYFTIEDPLDELTETMAIEIVKDMYEDGGTPPTDFKATTTYEV